MGPFADSLRGCGVSVELNRRTARASAEVELVGGAGNSPEGMISFERNRRIIAPAVKESFG